MCLGGPMSNRKADSFRWSALNFATLLKLQAGVATVFSLLALFSLVPLRASAAQMKLLAPNTGWVAGGNTLYWTTDGGNHWTNITPAPPEVRPGSATLSNVFFLDTSEGWAIISYQIEVPPTSPANPRGYLGMQHTVYEIAHTVNSGESWTFTPLTYPELPASWQETFAGPVDLYFLDSQHGWLDLEFEGLMRPGKLLATEDGGSTWHWVNGPGPSGRMSFSTPQDGWLIDGWRANLLFVTHDGCKTWQKVILSPPLQAGAAIYAAFEDPPVFENGRQGFLLVQYSGTFSTPTKLVIYSSVDGGQTWQVAKVLSLIQKSPGRAYIPFAIVDSSLIVSTGPSARNVASIPLLNGGSSDVRASASDLGVHALSFADGSNGWALSAKGLIATQDGGRTWKYIGLQPAHSPQPGKIVPSTSGPGMIVTHSALSSSGLQPFAQTAMAGTPTLADTSASTAQLGCK